MQTFDYGITSETIAPFFEGSTDTPPVEALFYLEEHPLVRPSFFADITLEVESVMEKVDAGKLSEQLVGRIAELATTFAVLMTGIRSEEVKDKEEMAGKALIALRELRRIYLFLTD